MLATEVERERVDAGLTVVCGAWAEESPPRFVVTVMSWASGVVAGWCAGAPGVVYPAMEPSNVGFKVL